MDVPAEQGTRLDSISEIDFNRSDGVGAAHETPCNANQIQDQETQHDIPEDVPHSTEFSADYRLPDHDLEEQDKSYVPLPKGFSDDEDDKDAEAFDGTVTNHQSRKPSPNSKKSPRRPREDSDHEASPRTKKPRQSLFGGPSGEYEHEQDEQEELDRQPGAYDGQKQVDRHLAGEVDEMTDVNTPGQNIGNRMSSLNLDEQERHCSPSQRPFSLGFGLNSPDRNSLSPRASPAPSEDSVIIPPDTQVSGSFPFPPARFV